MRKKLLRAALALCVTFLCAQGFAQDSDKTYRGTVVDKTCPAGQIAVLSSVRRESLPKGMTTFAYLAPTVDCLEVPPGLILKAGDEVSLVVRDKFSIELVGRYIPTLEKQP